MISFKQIFIGFFTATLINMSLVLLEKCCKICYSNIISEKNNAKKKMNKNQDHVENKNF